MAPTTIGIVGTAGRGADGAKMSKPLFDAMLAEAERIVEKQLKLKWENVTLVSGGAAWSGQLEKHVVTFVGMRCKNIFNICFGVFIDHVAVKLFHSHGCGLTLFFPCRWDDKTSKFVDIAVSDWRQNPGRSANRYHANFKSNTGYEPYKDIQAAIQNGAIIDTSHHGFHARNTAIAKNSNILIAFSWGTGNMPTDGGTLDQWRKCKALLKIHVPLRDILARVVKK
jgi:hypothetical protein